MTADADAPLELKSTALTLPLPLGSTTQRVATPIHTLTRMQDALQSLIQNAHSIPDFELMPWLERELRKAALRHFQGDNSKAGKLLGVPVPPVVKTEPRAAEPKPNVQKSSSRSRKAS